MSLKVMPIHDFRGGLDERSPSRELDNSQLAPGTNNVTYSRDAKSIEPRKGHKRFDTLAGIAFPAITDPTEVNNVFPFKVPPGPVTPGTWLAVAAEEGVYILEPGGAISQAQAATGGGRTWRFEVAADSTGVPVLWMTHPTSSRKITYATLGGASVAWAPIVNGKELCYWKGRMVIAAGNLLSEERLYFSDIGDPDTWPAGNFLDLRGRNDPSDPINNLVTLGEDLLVFRYSSMWRVFDSETFANERVLDMGTKNVEQAVVHKDRVYFLAEDGVMSTNGVDVKHESLALDYKNSTIAEEGKITATDDDRLIVVCGTTKIYECHLNIPSAIEGQPVWMVHDTVASNFTPRAVAHDDVLGIVSAGTTIEGTPKTAVGQLMSNGWHSDKNFLNGANAAFTPSIVTPWLAMTEDLEGYGRLVRAHFHHRRKGTAPVAATGGKLAVAYQKDWTEGAVIGSTEFTTDAVDPDTKSYRSEYRPRVKTNAFRLHITLRGSGTVDASTTTELLSLTLKFRGGDEE